MTRRNAIKNTALAAVTSLALLAVFEGVGQRVLFRDQLYFVRDVDHRMAPDGAGINEDGIRCRVPLDAIADTTCNVVLLGDSFVFGYRLDAEETLGARLDSLLNDTGDGPRVRVFNFGWISASPLLSLRQLRDIGEHYRPDIVVACVDMSDFHDDLKYARLFEGGGVYRLLDVVPISVLVLKRVLASLDGQTGWHRAVFGLPGDRFFACKQPFARSREDLLPLVENLRDIATWCRVRDVRFTAVFLPRGFQYSDEESPQSWERGQYDALGPYATAPFDLVPELRESEAFPVFSLLSDFQNTSVFPTCFEDDPHWTPAGADVAARALAARLRDAGLVCTE